jgi:hypothetical protein
MFHRRRWSSSLLAGTNDVSPDWNFWEEGGNWDTCHNVSYMSAKLTGAE